MERVVDLHNHTPLIRTDYADLSAGPHDLVKAALAAGIEVLGITDHSSVAYFRPVEDAASCMGAGRLLVVPGAELKVRWADDETHLIVLLPPSSAEETFALLQDALGMDHAVPYDDLPWVTVEHDPREVARAAVELGAICHVGHADRAFSDYRLIDRPLIEAMAGGPFCAVELLDLASAALLPEWASGLPLLRSSDAHAPAQMGRRTTTLEMEALSFDGLRAALSRRTTRAAG